MHGALSWYFRVKSKFMNEGKFEQREKSHIGELVIATGNPAKFERYAKGLKEYFDAKLSSLRDEHLEKVDEPFDTAEANARHKAQEYFKQCGKPVLAVDEALYLDFLPPDQQPGVAVRRIGGGEEVSDDELLARVLDLVKKAPADKRVGRWHFAICVVNREGSPIGVQHDLTTVFITEPSPVKAPGYPLSRIHIPEGFDRPKSELSASEHRRLDAELMAKVAEAVRQAMGIK